MEPDDLLCSRNARSRTPLVGRAQWKINQPPSLTIKRATLEGEWRGGWYGLCARRASTMKRWSLDARNVDPISRFARCM